MPSTPNLKQISAFVAVCETGSFSAAARREHLAQSGISQHVTALETVVGARLLDRGRYGVTLTLVGQRYYSYCIDALRALQSGQNQVESLQGRISGALRVGFPPMVGAQVIACTLQRFSHAYSDVRVQIVEGVGLSLAEHLRAGELDFALIHADEEQQILSPAGRTESPHGLSASLIGSDREMLLCRARNKSVPGKYLAPVAAAKLNGLDVILPGRGSVRWRALDRYLRANDVHLSKIIEIDSLTAARQLAMTSDWCAILPGLAVLGDREDRRLKIQPLSDPSLPVAICLLQPARRPLSLPAGLFLQELRVQVGRAHRQWDCKPAA